MGLSSLSSLDCRDNTLYRTRVVSDFFNGPPDSVIKLGLTDVSLASSLKGSVDPYNHPLSRLAVFLASYGLVEVDKE